jgi:hypothetical protein
VVLARGRHRGAGLKVALVVACILAGAACGRSGNSPDADRHSQTARITTATTSSSAPTRAPVVFFGDSLTAMSVSYLQDRADAEHRPMVVYATPGFAMCDWMTTAEALLQSTKVAVVVLAFAGNNYTECVKDLTGPDLIAVYERDARRIAALGRARGVPVVLAGPPAMQAPRWTEDARLMNERFAAIARETPGVRYVDTGNALSPHGFAFRLPCLRRETAAEGCAGGMIVVRHFDGIHFDEPGGDGYSSGSFRFARVLLEAAGAAR